MPKKTTARLKERVPPEQRLDLEEKAKANIEAARGLLKKKKYKDAYKQFKLALASAEGTEIFPNALEMKKLAKNYRPALVAIKRWRNQKEKLILAGTADSTVISQWETLNDSLGEQGRILSVFRKLQSAGADEEVLDSFFWKLWKTLVKTKEYGVLRPFLNTLGWLTLQHVSEHHAEIWFPRGGNSCAYPTTEIIKDGAMVYEIAIALREYDSANIISDKLLSIQDDDSTYAILIQAARRAGDKVQSIELYRRALERFGTRRVSKSKTALGPLANSARKKKLLYGSA